MTRSVPTGTWRAALTPSTIVPPWVRRLTRESKRALEKTPSVSTRNGDDAPSVTLTPTESPMNAKVPALVRSRRIGTSSKPGAGNPNAFRKSQALTVDPLPRFTRLPQMPS
jgi:hypothetical protein